MTRTTTANRTTYYVIQSFTQLREGLKIDTPVQKPDATQAIRLGKRLAESKAGVVVFSRTGDPALGEFDDPLVLYRHGTIPYEIEELAAA